MLRIRQFVKGIDEQVWVNVLNAAYRESKDWRAITVEEFLSEETGHSFQFELKLITELNGKPVGVVHAYVEKIGKEKGFISDLCVIPEFHGSGVEEELLNSATDQLKAYGTSIIQLPRLRWLPSKGKDHIEFLEKSGFNLARKTSLMEIDLTEISSNVIGNTMITIRSFQKQWEEDIRTLSWLRNECSKEQYNYRPTKVEETRYFLVNNPYSYLEVFFAASGEKDIGYLVVAIDKKYKVEKNSRTGIILAVGVLKAYRRSGIGTKLVLHGLEVLKAKGMTSAMLDVDDLNQTGAMRLYEKIGFRVIEKYLTYEKTFE